MRGYTERALAASTGFLERLGMTGIETVGEMLVSAQDGDEKVLVGVFVSDWGEDVRAEAQQYTRVTRLMETTASRHHGYDRVDAVYITVLAEDRALLKYHRDLPVKRG